MALGVALIFYSSVTKWLKLKVRTFCGLTPTFVEVIEEKPVGGGGEPFCLPSLIRLTNVSRNVLSCPFSTNMSTKI